MERKEGANTESDVEDEEGVGVSDVWRARSPKVRHLDFCLCLCEIERKREWRRDLVLGFRNLRLRVWGKNCRGNYFCQ